MANSHSRLAWTSLGEGYPDKYLKSGWRQRQGAKGIGAKGAVIIPLSILFPVLVLLMISVTLGADDSSGSLDWQLGVRLTGYSLAALSVLFALGRRRLHLDPWIFAWALVPIFIIGTALYSPEPTFSFTAGLAHLALLLFTWRMVERQGQLRAVLAVVIAGTIICLLSIFVFYALPDVGRSSIGGETDRMQGIVAQPNSLGLISALTILLTIMHFKAFNRRQRLLAFAALGIAAFCVVYSDSRTSILAMLICVGMWWLCRANAALNLFAVVGIALVACLLIGFVPDVTAYISREGARYDDLASFNGRWDIWLVAWEYVREAPVLGYGYGSSRLFLPSDDRLFAAAVNTHNVYLELLFTGGAVLLAVYALALVKSVIRPAKEGRAEALIALLFFVIVGVAEATPFGGLPLFPAFVFYTAVSLCLAPSQRSRLPSRPRRIPPPMAGVRPVTVERHWSVR